MKVLVVSDIHGSSYYASKIPEIFEKEKANKIILLGDLYYHGPRNALTKEYNPMKVAEALNSLKQYIEAVKGNCDAEVDEMISEFKLNDNLLLDINGKKVFCTHGQNYNIDNLPNEKIDVMLYGHFHTGFIKEKDGIIFANPGSISLPKDNTENSYLTIDEEKMELKNTDGKVIDSINF